MTKLKTRRLRRADRFADKLQKEFDKLLSSYYFNYEDSVIMEYEAISALGVADKSTRDKILNAEPNDTILKGNVKRSKAQDFIFEDNVILRASHTIIEDILKTSETGWVFEDNIMMFGSEGIRDDILRKAKNGFVYEDHIMMLVKDIDLFYVASVSYIDPPMEARTIAIISRIPDENQKEGSFVGKLKGNFDKEGNIQKLYLADIQGPEPEIEIIQEKGGIIGAMIGGAKGLVVKKYGERQEVTPEVWVYVYKG